MGFIQEDHTDSMPIHGGYRSLSQIRVVIRLDGRARHAPPFGWSCLGVNINMHLLRVRLLSQQGKHSSIEIASIEGAFVRGISFDPKDRDRCWYPPIGGK